MFLRQGLSACALLLLLVGCAGKGTNPVEPQRVTPSKWQNVYSDLDGRGVWVAADSEVIAAGASGKLVLIRLGATAQWTINPTSPPAFTCVCGPSHSNGDAVAVGPDGLIMTYAHNFNPPRWISGQAPLTSIDLTGAWATAATDLFSVSTSGIICRAGTFYNPWWTAELRGVWGSSDTDVFAVGSGGTILHYDGNIHPVPGNSNNMWEMMTSGVSATIDGVWGSSGTDVFAVGAGGTILHYDGNTWSTMPSGVSAELRGAWGSAANDVFAVGSGGTILHYDGNAWSTMPSGTNADLWGVSGNSGSNVYAVGDGSILHYSGP